MSGSNDINSFQFHYNISIADKISNIEVGKFLTTIFNFNAFFALKRYASLFHFNLQGISIYSFIETMS